MIDLCLKKVQQDGSSGIRVLFKRRFETEYNKDH